jgi:alkylation response protein AidB-like acyl-CoA dehydrogenase
VTREDEMIRWLREYGEHHVRSSLWEERRTFPPHVVLDLAREGFFAMHVPEEYGGRPLSCASAMRIVEQLAAIDTTLASFVGVNVALGVRPIARFGSEASRARWLPELARGCVLGGLALTEPEAGSDPRAIKTAAERVTGGVHITGTKCFIGNASWSGVLNVFARVEGEGLAGFTVDARARGVSQGPEAMTMGMRAMVQNEVRFDRTFAPDDAQLGGLDALTDTLSYGRLGIAAMSLGAIERAAQLLHRYATRRRVGTGLLGAHPDTLDALARAAGAADLARAIVTFAAGAIDRGETIDDAYLAAAKIVIPELAFETVDAMLQRAGGRGYLEPSGFAQLLRDVRLFRIFEGPTEALTSHLGARARAPPEPLAALAGDEVLERAAAAKRSIRGASRERAQETAFALGAWVAPAILARLATTELARAVAGERRARADRPSLRVDVSAWMDDVHAHIGDVEQRAAGEDHALDPWLRRTM